jgi:hypothetical protein
LLIFPLACSFPSFREGVVFVVAGQCNDVLCSAMPCLALPPPPLMARQLPLKQQQQQLDGGRVSCALLCSNGVEFLLSLSLARSFEMAATGLLPPCLKKVKGPPSPGTPYSLCSSERVIYFFLDENSSARFSFEQGKTTTTWKEEKESIDILSGPCLSVSCFSMPISQFVFKGLESVFVTC